MDIVIIASGPSLTDEDVEFVRNKNADVVVVNSNWKKAPWAGTLYTNDEDWLESELSELQGNFFGVVVCGHPTAELPVGVIRHPYDKEAKGLFSNKPGHISWGMNSGSAAISWACTCFVVGRILLLGFDQQWTDGKPRWHGRHKEHLQNQKPGFHRWAVWFEQAAKDAKEAGIEIINCSRATSLTCFPRMTIQEAFRSV